MRAEETSPGPLAAGEGSGRSNLDEDAHPITESFLDQTEVAQRGCPVEPMGPALWFATIAPGADGRFIYAKVPWPSGADAILSLGAALRGGSERHPAHPWATITNVRDRDGARIDEVAWLPGQPHRWWTRYGAALLGESAVWMAREAGLPLLLICNPEAWVENEASAGGYRPAASVLEWSIPVDLHFAGVREIVADSPALERVLVERLVRAPRPRFRVRRAAA